MFDIDICICYKALPLLSHCLGLYRYSTGRKYSLEIDFKKCIMTEFKFLLFLDVEKSFNDSGYC